MKEDTAGLNCVSEEKTNRENMLQDYVLLMGKQNIQYTIELCSKITLGGSAGLIKGDTAGLNHVLKTNYAGNDL
jgi:hypothetical protein